MDPAFINDLPIDFGIVNQKIAELNLPSVGKASIRETKKLIDTIERATEKKFIRMEMGIPGLPPSSIGTEAEIEALRAGIAAIYPDIDGIPPLKAEISRFVKNFLDIDVKAECCIPTVGSMQGSFASFLTLARMYKERDTTLFIDPGFPVHKLQHTVLGQKFESFDVYEFRGEKLREKLESYFIKGNIHSVLYSNPNNPSWICFNDQELRIIGDLATNHIIPIAIRYQNTLIENVRGLKEVIDTKTFVKLSNNQLQSIKEISEHISTIRTLVFEMTEARKTANALEGVREKAGIYHDLVLSFFDKIRYHVDKLELLVDDELWPLPKYRELLFIR